MNCQILWGNWTVHVGVLEDLEIDFVGIRGDSVVYVQAALYLAGEETRSRELGNLLKIKDNHPKYVVSMDPLRADELGVRHLSLREFLLMNTL